LLTADHLSTRVHIRIGLVAVTDRERCFDDDPALRIRGATLTTSAKRALEPKISCATLLMSMSPSRSNVAPNGPNGPTVTSSSPILPSLAFEVGFENRAAARLVVNVKPARGQEV
jgi:hypothetical protein